MRWDFDLSGVVWLVAVGLIALAILAVALVGGVGWFLINHVQIV